MRWFKSDADKKADELKEQESLAEDFKLKNTELEKLRATMNSSPCAIIGFKNCNPKCIHYNPGHVAEIVFDSVNYILFEPECKLWR